MNSKKYRKLKKMINKKMLIILVIYLIQIIAISAACSPPSCIHGKCNLGTCECYAGWEGNFCTNLTQCSQDCHSGLCVDNSCTCIDDWSGPKCDFENSCPVSCVNGICEGSVCYCQNGWTGVACEIENVCSEPCDKGECFTGECLCQDGYTGETCDVTVADEISKAKDELNTLSIVVFGLGGASMIGGLGWKYRADKQRREIINHNKENNDTSDLNIVIETVEVDSDEDEGDVETNGTSKGVSTPRDKFISASRTGSTINLRVRQVRTFSKDNSKSQLSNSK